jgi:hypothetical protein
MIKRIGVGTAVVAVGGPAVLLQTACQVKDIAFYVSTVVGALGELSPLLPGAAGLIATAVKVANDFLAKYKAGDFSNATAIFQNLVSTITQIASDVGVNNPTVKIILAIASVAVHAIAALLSAQVPPAVRTKMASKANASLLAQASVVDKLANPTTIDQIFAATRP